jgi:glycosyltransferase involved in cell wall biosynthesis
MRVYVFANTILFHSSISGGDVVLPQLAKRWGSRYDLQVITTVEGRKVWERLGVSAHFHLLPPTFLDRSENLLLGPFKYFVRTVQSIRLANRLISGESGRFFLYSPGDFLPDTLPQFWFRWRYRNSRWVAWVYHLILPPWRRKGNFFFNLFSYLLQRVGLWLVRSRADAVLVLGGSYRDLLKLGFPKSKLYSSAIGVPTAVIKRVPPLPDSYDAVHVGTLTYTKGVYDLLEIWQQVCRWRPAARLAVVGGGSPELVKTYRRRIRKLGLGDKVNYYGFVPRNEDVYRIIKSSKVYICPGHENGWSLPVAEAMTAGVPTVAYNLKMFGTAFKRGFVTVPLYDPQALADKVLELLDDQELYRRLSREALAESQNFDWSNITLKIEKLLEKLSAS